MLLNIHTSLWHCYRIPLLVNYVGTKTLVAAEIFLPDGQDAFVAKLHNSNYFAVSVGIFHVQNHNAIQV